MSTLTCRCGTPIAETEAFTYQGETICESCYLGDKGAGPLAAQFVPCPRCGQVLHRFAVVCPACRTAIREIGKIEATARGNVGKGIAFVVTILVLAFLSMGLGDRAFGKGMSLAAVIPLGIGGFLLGINALLGLLYFRAFALVTFLRGIPGFVLGGVCLLLSGLLYVLMI
jgi:hypothetical protein